MRTELLGVLAATALLAPTAAADEPGIELSRDGRTWTSALAGPVLDEDVRIVPGGSTRADLWVRNSSGSTTTLSVTTRGISSTLPDGVAARDDFRVRVGEAHLTSATAGGCRVAVTTRLAPDAVVRVPMSVSLPETSRSVSERASVTVPVRVHLVEGPAGEACGGVDDPPLKDPPETPGVVQTDGGPWEPPSAADLLAAGLVLAAASLALRRRARARPSRPTS